MHCCCWGLESLAPGSHLQEADDNGSAGKEIHRVVRLTDCHTNRSSHKHPAMLLTQGGLPAGKAMCDSVTVLIKPTPTWPGCGILLLSNRRQAPSHREGSTGLHPRGLVLPWARQQHAGRVCCCVGKRMLAGNCEGRATAAKVQVRPVIGSRTCGSQHTWTVKRCPINPQHGYTALSPGIDQPKP